jgi:hypothetical protein
LNFAIEYLLDSLAILRIDLLVAPAVGDAQSVILHPRERVRPRQFRADYASGPLLAIASRNAPLETLQFLYRHTCRRPSQLPDPFVTRYRTGMRQENPCTKLTASSSDSVQPPPSGAIESASTHARSQCPARTEVRAESAETERSIPSVEFPESPPATSLPGTAGGTARVT